MKFFALLLSLCLLLSGCQAPQKAQVPDGAFSENYQGAAVRQERVVLYNETAYYECDPYERSPWQPHVYSLQLGNGEKATDLLKGELVGLFGSVLLGKTATHYCAMDLDAAKPRWVTLDTAAEEKASFTYQNKAYLFHHQDLNHVDVLDLSTLKSSRTAITPQVDQVLLKDDDLYYIATVDGKRGFYKGDLTARNAQLLCEVAEKTTATLMGEQIFLSSVNENPILYDLKSEKCHIPEDIVGDRDLYPSDVAISYSVYEPESIVIVRTYEPNHPDADLYGNRTRTYQLPAWNEVSDFQQRFAVREDKTYQNGDTAYDDGTVTYWNGAWYKDPGDHVALDDSGWAYLQDTCIETVSFKTNTKNQLIHYEQKVLTE